MELEEFNKLILNNFDVSFNYNDVYYMISAYDENGKTYISLANEENWFVDFNSIDELDNYVLFDKPICEIIVTIPRDEIFW